MSVILCYGDSNTHGTAPIETLGVMSRHARPDRWPNVLAASLTTSHEIISEGLPGRTTVHDDVIEGGMRNGLTVMPAILQSHKPIDLLVIMLGTNDLKPAFGVGSFEIARSVERLVRAARLEDAHKQELIVAPVPVVETGVLAPVFAGAEQRQRTLSADLAKAADRLGCAFWDAGAHAQVSMVDGVHWDRTAHHKVGRAIATKISQIVQS